MKSGVSYCGGIIDSGNDCMIWNSNESWWYVQMMLCIDGYGLKYVHYWVYVVMSDKLDYLKSWWSVLFSFSFIWGFFGSLWRQWLWHIEVMCQSGECGIK